MSDPMIEASTTGWIAKHREKYLADGESGHLWDSTFAGGPGPLPTLLLTTIGRKSGKESVMPLLYGAGVFGVRWDTLMPLSIVLWHLVWGVAVGVIERL